ncbi:Rho-binding antiterminator [Pseudoteredinibacter isoporae]|uniref:Rho-binding antiterminator n=1 Tax=Pseudoteredinibacter isoporae TaxID=570281 RepID=UPI00310957E2
MLSCQIYDVLELCCIYHLAIKVELVSGQCIHGVPSDIAKDDNGEEVLEILLHAVPSKMKHPIKLKHIVSIEALVQNPHFDKVEFLPDTPK